MPIAVTVGQLPISRWNQPPSHNGKPHRFDWCSGELTKRAISTFVLQLSGTKSVFLWDGILWADVPTNSAWATVLKFYEQSWPVPHGMSTKFVRYEVITEVFLLSFPNSFLIFHAYFILKTIQNHCIRLFSQPSDISPSHPKYEVT